MTFSEFVLLFSIFSLIVSVVIAVLTICKK